MDARIEQLQAPAAVKAGLRSLVTALGGDAGDAVAGLVVYGDVAKGRYRGGGPVQVALLLHAATTASLERVAPALRDAWREVRVEPFLLTTSEVRAAADVFPTKLLDIQRHHVVLLGDDPFHDLVVDREHLRLRVEQELRNVSMRLRRIYVGSGRDAQRLRLELLDLLEPLAVSLAELLRLRGHAVPDDAAPAVFAAAGKALDLDEGALAGLDALAAGSVPPAATLNELFARLLATVARAADLANDVPGRPA